MRTRAYCGGTFDLLHPGHVRFFRWVKKNYDWLIVGLNTDEFVSRYKAPSAQTFDERYEMLRACRWVDDIITNRGCEDSKPAIIAAHPTHIINGSDWTTERLIQQMGLTQEFLTQNGLTIVQCPLPREYSTTELKERICGKH